MPKDKGYGSSSARKAPEDANSGGVPTKGMPKSKKAAKSDGPSNRPRGR